MADKHKAKKGESKATVPCEQKPPSVPSEQKEFDDFFTDICTQMQVFDVPIIKHFDVNVSSTNMPSVPLSSDRKRDKSTVNLEVSTTESVEIHDVLPELHVYFENIDKTLFAKKLEYKSPLFISEQIFCSFEYITTKFDTIDTLVLRDCGLDAEQITMLGCLLTTCLNITYLDLDYNPNDEQNFYELLRKNTCLKYLSLKYCKIDDVGIDKIADELNTTTLTTLHALNLSSNAVTDFGAGALATSLRINRTLLSLNLADNFITDIGAAKLLDTLRIFPLDASEIVFRRRRKFESLYKRRETLRSRTASAEYVKRPSVASAKTGGSYVSFMSKRRTSLKDSSSFKSKSSCRGLIQHKKSDRAPYSEQCTNSTKDDEDSHPFVKDCIAQNGKVYCTGNFKIVYLNLSYNKLTSASVRMLIDVVKYQTDTFYKTHYGLHFANIDGNKCREEDVAELYALVCKNNNSGQENDTVRGSTANVGAKKTTSHRK